MAGSTTQSVESFAAQGMECHHQIMMNTEVMKHFRIMNRASVREIMLQHEKTFKEQVHDLHKLYGVQRLLMEKSKSRGVDGYIGAPPPTPPPPSACADVFSEEANQSRQRRNFWQPITPEIVGAVKGATTPMQPLLTSAEKAYTEKNMRFEDTPKMSNSPVRKRKIDLEQLPEDDSDEEIEMPVNLLNSSLSRNSREFMHGLSDCESMIKLHPNLFDGTGLRPVQPAKESQAGNLPTGEYKNHINGNGGSSFYLFQHGKATSGPSNIVKAEQSSLTIGDRNPSSQNACTINMGMGAIKSNTVFLPQADLIDRASQDVGKNAHWLYQAAEPNTTNRSSKSPLQQTPRLSPHVALPELSTGRSQLHNGVFQGSPNLEQRHHNNQSSSLGSVSVGDWSKALVEKQPPGLAMGAQKDRPFSLSERLGDASRWLTKEQGPNASVVPIARVETKASEGGPVLPNIVAPAISISGGKGSSQERDLNLWPPQSPIVQLPPYQQPSVFQSQVFPSVNQGVWLQPPQTMKSSVYPQQMVYSVHSSDSSQIGYRNEPLQRNQGEMAGPWSMLGHGHYYASVPSAPQKPPFKKPPKLILKNDGVGTELKLVSPDKEMSEKANQKKATISLKKDLLQDISKALERKSTVQKEVKDEDQKLDKRVSVGFQALASVEQGREPSKISNVPLEPKFLATATPCPTQEIILPKECSLATVAVSTISQCIVGAAAGARNGVVAAGPPVHASPDKWKSQPSISQAENVLSSRSQENMSEKSFPSPESESVACVKEKSILADHSIDKDLQRQKAESSLFQCKDDPTRRDPKTLPAQLPKAEAVATDILATCQAESFKEVALAKPEEENVFDINTCAKQLQKSDVNPCKEVEQPKGSLSVPSASSDSSSKDASHNEGLIQGRSAGHSADLTNSLCPPVVQALSVQSTSTNTPAIPASDKACSSTSSPKYRVSDTKHDVKLGEDLQLDFDNDNLAASILLSFAPKLDLSNEEKQAKSDASAVSSGGRKDRPTDQASTSSRKERRGDQEPRKTPQIVEGTTALRTQTSNLGGGQGRRMQGQGSLKRVDRMDHMGLMKSTMKDRLRTDRRNYDEPETDKTGEDPVKSLTIKLPRVSGSLNDEAIPISRSKQLSKLNGETLTGDSGEHAKNFKGNDAFHAPTGRRSSRGPPLAGRVLHENGSRSHQPTRHRVEGSSNTTERDSGSREEAAVLRSKADGNMRSKAWGELNKTRNHPRKQFQDTSHRKTQR